MASHNGRPQWEATVGGHSWTVFPLWPPTMGGHIGRPQWEATVGIPRIKNQKPKSQESKVKGSKNPKESKSQRVKNQRVNESKVKGSIVKSQRINKSLLIGVTRWDNAFLQAFLQNGRDYLRNAISA